MSELAEISIDDVSIVNVSAYSSSITEIDIVVSFTCIASYRTHKMVKAGYDPIKKKVWTKGVFHADVEKRLEDISFLTYEPYDAELILGDPLNGDLVPTLQGKTFEEVAMEILKTYQPYGEHGEFDLSLLPRRMGVDVVFARLSNDDSVFGKIIFEDKVFPVYYRVGNRIVAKEEAVQAETILIDHFAQKCPNIDTVNLYIAHECVHYHLHKKAMLFEKMLDSQYEFQDVNIEWDENDDSRPWIEKQAFGIAPYLAMPTEDLKKTVHSFAVMCLSGAGNSARKKLPFLLECVASYYKVCRQTVKKRLRQAGYLFANGALDWADGKYVPTAIVKCELGKDETITIETQELSYLLQESPEFRAMISGGCFVFLENHIVFDSPKYVQRVGRRIKMTDYAREHAEECCLIFKKTVLREPHGSSVHDGSLCFKVQPGYGFNIEISRNITLMDDPEYKSSQDETNRIIDETLVAIESMDFKQSIAYVIDKSKKTNKEIRCTTGLTITTIERYRDGAAAPEKELFALLCIALMLPGEIVLALLEKAEHFQYTRSKRDRFILSSIPLMGGYSKSRIDKFFINSGYSPLAPKKKK